MFLVPFYGLAVFSFDAVYLLARASITRICPRILRLLLDMGLFDLHMRVCGPPQGSPSVKGLLTCERSEQCWVLLGECLDVSANA